MSVLGFGNKVHQEFYCRHCPADDANSKDPDKRRSGGHFRVKFSLGWDSNVKIQCPKCKHVHERHVKNGVLYDGLGNSPHTEEVKVGLSAWSREPFTKKAESLRKFKQDEWLGELRGNNVIASPDDLSKKAKEAALAAAKRGAVLQIHKPDATDEDPTPETSQ
jgi:hypothetical protein